MGFLIIAIMLLAAAELVRAFLHIIRKLPEKGAKRRRAHIISGFSIIIISIIVFTAGIINASEVDTTEYSVEIKKSCSAGDLRVVQLADIHIGYQQSTDKIKRVVEAVNAQNPDVVVISGDVFDGGLDEVFDLTRIKSEISKINTKYGVFACLGNHDMFTPALETFFSECGITLLTDEAVLVADSFYVVGRNDRNLETFRREDREELSEIIRGIDKTKPIIVLDHRPQSIEESAENGVDLLLCGHSHAGQTFPITLITHSIYEVNYGLAVFGDMSMVVTSGTGLWGPPTRIGTDSEIVVIDVRFSV